MISAECKSGQCTKESSEVCCGRYKGKRSDRRRCRMKIDFMGLERKKVNERRNKNRLMGRENERDRYQ